MMDREEIRARLNSEFEAAVGYSDSQLSSDRQEATDYYLGRPWNTPAEGRSSTQLKPENLENLDLLLFLIICFLNLIPINSYK